MKRVREREMGRNIKEMSGLDRGVSRVTNTGRKCTEN